jgi:glutaredoxin 3
MTKLEQSKVKIYSTKTCVYCKMTKDFFNKNNIKYEEIDVGADRKAAAEMIKKSGQMGVPVIEIGNQIIVGYNKESISKLLNI